MPNQIDESLVSRIWIFLSAYLNIATNRVLDELYHVYNMVRKVENLIDSVANRLTLAAKITYTKLNDKTRLPYTSNVIFNL